MIKCSGFGKLLKQLFITSLISFFGLSVGSFASAVNNTMVQTVGLQDSPSIVDSQYDLTFLKGGAFKSMFLGQSKSILALNNQNFLFWNNGKLYVFYNYHRSGYGTINFQGYYQKYNSCNEITGFDYTPTNCSEQLIGDDYATIFQTFFQNVKAGDYVYYKWYGFVGDVSENSDFDICFSNSVLHKSICFLSDQGIIPGNLLTGSTTFATIPYSVIGYAPGQAGYDGGGNIDGGSQDVTQAQITGDTMNLSCTNEMAFNWYRANGYKSRMCYSSYSNNTDIFSGAGSVEAFALTGTEMLDIWFDTWDYRRYGLTGESMDYNTWFSYWRKTYEVYKKNSGNVTNPFIGVPVSLFTLMGNVDSYGLPYSDSSILEFCKLSNYYYTNSSQNNSVYSGIAKNTVCSMSTIQFLDIILANENNPDDGMPGDGDTDGTEGDIGSSWDGVTNRPGQHNKPGSNGSGGNNGSGSSGSGSGLTTYQNGKTFQNDFFNQLKSSFIYSDYTGNGVLPSYIIITLCALIFFRFLRHG